MDLSPDAPAPRHCYLVKWPDFDGYGFNLHAEKNKPGQFIGKVDDNSPAQAAGLRCGDRIIEVNNVNIANENHKQVVERIKAVPGETKLLVVDDSADKYYKERKMVVKHTMSNVIVIKTPASKKEYEAKMTNGDEKQNEEKRPETPVSIEPVTEVPDVSSDKIISSNSIEESVKKEEVTREKDEKKEEVKAEVKPVTPVMVNKNEESFEKEELPTIESPAKELPIIASPVKESPIIASPVKESPIIASPIKESPKLKKEILNATSPSPKASPKPSPKPEVNERPKTEIAGNGTANGTANGSPRPTSMNGSAGTKPNGQEMLNLNMSAQEMRELIASRSKNRYDPKKESMDLRKKYAIVQSM